MATTTTTRARLKFLLAFVLHASAGNAVFYVINSLFLVLPSFFDLPVPEGKTIAADMSFVSAVCCSSVCLLIVLLLLSLSSSFSAAAATAAATAAAAAAAAAATTTASPFSNQSTEHTTMIADCPSGQCPCAGVFILSAPSEAKLPCRHGAGGADGHGLLAHHGLPVESNPKQHQHHALDHCCGVW